VVLGRVSALGFCCARPKAQRIPFCCSLRGASWHCRWDLDAVPAKRGATVSEQYVSWRTSVLPVPDSTGANTPKASTEIGAQTLAVATHCSWKRFKSQEKGYTQASSPSPKAPGLASLPASPQHPHFACSRRETHSKMLNGGIRRCPGNSSPARGAGKGGRRGLKRQGDRINSLPETGILEGCNTSVAQCTGNASWLNPLLLKHHSNLYFRQAYGSQSAFPVPTQLSEILAIFPPQPPPPGAHASLNCSMNIPDKMYKQACSKRAFQAIASTELSVQPLTNSSSPLPVKTVHATCCCMWIWESRCSLAAWSGTAESTKEKSVSFALRHVGLVTKIKTIPSPWAHHSRALLAECKRHTPQTRLLHHTNPLASLHIKYQVYLQTASTWHELRDARGENHISVNYLDECQGKWLNSHLHQEQRCSGRHRACRKEWLHSPLTVHSAQPPVSTLSAKPL